LIGAAALSRCSCFQAALPSMEKVLNCVSGFQDLEKVLDLVSFSMQY